MFGIDVTALRLHCLEFDEVRGCVVQDSVIVNSTDHTMKLGFTLGRKGTVRRSTASTLSISFLGHVYCYSKNVWRVLYSCV
jgi:hypothetical protein